MSDMNWFRGLVAKKYDLAERAQRNDDIRTRTGQDVARTGQYSAETERQRNPFLETRADAAKTAADASMIGAEARSRDVDQQKSLIDTKGAWERNIQSNRATQENYLRGQEHKRNMEMAKFKSARSMLNPRGNFSLEDTADGLMVFDKNRGVGTPLSERMGRKPVTSGPTSGLATAGSTEPSAADRLNAGRAADQRDAKRRKEDEKRQLNFSSRLDPSQWGA